MNLKNYKIPCKIICLTEESVETLFRINKGHLIAGVSSYVKRPREAQELPKVSMFQTSNYKKIRELDPDLILGYSDIQKDIARDLINMGFDVYIANHRSLEELFNYVYRLGLMVDGKNEVLGLIDEMQNKIKYAQDFAKNLKVRPRIYFEEWDEPRISAIRYVSDIIEVCGGVDINRELSSGFLATERVPEDLTIINSKPDLILGCWCGKKVKISSIKERDGYERTPAVMNDNVFELEPEIFLQPGPALILDGIDILIDIIKKWSDENV
jgi:iron complex transport system substrate-binding protein